MCVGVPGKIILIKGEKAKIKQDDHFHWVDISSFGDKLKKGDYLISYQGFAVNKVSSEEAEEIIKLMDGAGNARVKSSN